MPARETTKNGGVPMTMVQRIIVGVLLIIVSANYKMGQDRGDSLSELRGDYRVLNEQNIHLREIVERSMGDRYRSTEARADFALRDERTTSLTERIATLETKMDTMKEK